MFASFSKLQTDKSSKSSTGMLVKPIHLIAPLPGARLWWFPHLQSSAQCRSLGLDSPGRASTVLWAEPRQPQPQGWFPSVLSVSHLFFGLAFHLRHLSQTPSLAGFLHITAVLKLPFSSCTLQGWDHRPSLVSGLYKVTLNDTDAWKASALGDFEALEISKGCFKLTYSCCSLINGCCPMMVAGEKPKLFCGGSHCSTYSTFSCGWGNGKWIMRS